MRKIYLIRHGETNSNNDRKFQGRIDTPLNITGIEQARKLAAYMKQFPLDAIYCSIMQRARMTAEPLAVAMGLSVNYVKEFREVSFGDWEGLTYWEIKEKWSKEINLFFAKPAEFVPPRGETFQEVQDRSFGALNKILKEQDGNIAIISHGGVIRALICQLLNMPLNSFWKINIYNASVSVFGGNDGNFIAEIINDSHYL